MKYYCISCTANETEETDRKIRAYLQARLRVSPHVAILFPKSKYCDSSSLMQAESQEKFIDKR
jgi:hypothetical protein